MRQNHPVGLISHPYAEKISKRNMIAKKSLYRINLSVNIRPALVVGFPSGQRDQTVNLTAQPSKVRILPPPPFFVTMRSPVVGFPSGQRDQTVNLTAQPSKVRILPHHHLYNLRYPVVGFPSGQRDQTVNLTAQPSKVRILLPPPSFKTKAGDFHRLLSFLRLQQFNTYRPCGAHRSCSGPFETIPVGLMVLWLT